VISADETGRMEGEVPPSRLTAKLIPSPDKQAAKLFAFSYSGQSIESRAGPDEKARGENQGESWGGFAI
jgi:hypothetical protein